MADTIGFGLNGARDAGPEVCAENMDLIKTLALCLLWTIGFTAFLAGGALLLIWLMPGG